MSLTEVEKVFEKLRLEKVSKRAQLMEFRKTEPRLVLSEEDKHKMIANMKAAMREDKDDVAKWIELRNQYRKNNTYPVNPLYHTYSADGRP